MARRKTGKVKMKLLNAAGDIFVEKGFRDATIAEICNRADANISAVNYYFGSKEALYQEAWRHAFEESIKAHPQDGGVAEDAPPKARLQGRMRALIERIADENSKDFFISQMELVNPTGLLSEVMKSELIPLRENTLSVVREILGPEATERQVQFCETCIISMCIHPILIQRIRKRTNDVEIPAVIDDLQAFIDFVMTFTSAGIAAVKAEPDQ